MESTTPDANCSLEEILVGSSPAMVAIRRLVMRVAATDGSVMIHGESGVGKEHLARTVHRTSRRSKAPFIAMDMGTVPPRMPDRPLFRDGHRFFPAASHTLPMSWCKSADGGTLFLDEIGAAEPPVQLDLLRLLEEGTIPRVDTRAGERVDVRIITATSRAPDRMVAEGVLRRDLFFRLHVIPIHLPPLRERREDIEELAVRFLRRVAARHERPVQGFTREALDVLPSFHWPGNVRQLENAVERMAIFASGSLVEASDVPAEFHLAGASPGSGEFGFSMGDADCVDRFSAMEQFRDLTVYQRQERAVILDALQQAEGHVVEAARLLGLGQATVYRKIKQYEIPRKRSQQSRQPS